MYLYLLVSAVLVALSLENRTRTMLMNRTKFTWQYERSRESNRMRKCWRVPSEIQFCEFWNSLCENGCTGVCVFCVDLKTVSKLGKIEISVLCFVLGTHSVWAPNHTSADDTFFRPLKTVLNICPVKNIRHFPTSISCLVESAGRFTWNARGFAFVTPRVGLQAARTRESFTAKRNATPAHRRHRLQNQTHCNLTGPHWGGLPIQHRTSAKHFCTNGQGKCTSQPDCWISHWPGCWGWWVPGWSRSSLESGSCSSTWKYKYQCNGPNTSSLFLGFHQSFSSPTQKLNLEGSSEPKTRLDVFWAPEWINCIAFGCPMQASSTQRWSQGGTRSRSTLNNGKSCPGEGEGWMDLPARNDNDGNVIILGRFEAARPKN